MLLALLEPALTEAGRAGGRELSALSMTMDFAPSPGQADLEVKAWVERATRTLVFASAEARVADGGALAAAVSAVFRIEGAAR